MTQAREIVQKGYDQACGLRQQSEKYAHVSSQYKGNVFKVPTFSGWLVIASGPEMVDDIRKANDDQLSLKMGMADVCTGLRPEFDGALRVSTDNKAGSYHWTSGS